MAVFGAGAIRAGLAYVELGLKDNLAKGLMKAGARLKTFGRSVSKAGKSMVAFGAAATLPFILAGRAYASFSDQMKTVQAVTGATGKDFDMLTEKAKLLGRTTSFTASQVAAGMVEFARLGFKPQQIEAVIGPALDLARATGTELAEAVQIGAGALRAFELDVSESQRVIDVLVATANNSSQTLTDLGESLKYAAPIAKEFGMSVEDTSKALGLMANMQIKGSMAGTGLRQMLLQLSDPAIRAKLQKQNLEGTSFAETLMNVGKAMSAMGGRERLAFAKDIFGMRAAGGALKLAKGGFDDLNDAIDNANGTAARTAKTMDSGIGGSFRKLMSAIEGVAIALFEAIEGALSEWISKLIVIAGAITTWLEENKKLVATVALIIAGVIAVGAGLVALGVTIQVVAFAFTGLGMAITATIVVVKFLIAAIAFLISPIGLVILAVTSLGVILWNVTGIGEKVCDKLKKSFSDLLGWTKHVFGGIRDALLSGDIALAGKIMWLALKDVWLRGVQWLKEAWIGFKLFVFNTFDSVVGWVQKRWTDMCSFLVMQHIKAVEQIAKHFKNLTGIDLWTAEIKGFRTGMEAEFAAQKEGVDARNRKRRRDRELKYGKELDKGAKAIADNRKALDRAILEAAKETEEKAEEAGKKLGKVEEGGTGGAGDKATGKYAVKGVFNSAAMLALGRVGGGRPVVQRLDKLIRINERQFGELQKRQQFGLT